MHSKRPGKSATGSREPARQRDEASTRGSTADLSTLSDEDIRRQFLEQRATLQKDEISLLASAIANLSEGVMISLGHRKWPDSRIVFVNGALCRMLGYAEAELRGTSPRALLPDTFDARLTRRMEKQLAEDHEFLRELVLLRKDGTEQEAELLISPFSNSDNTFGNYVAIVRSVSEWNRSQEQLQELRRDVLRSADEVQLRIGRALHDGPQQALSGLAFISRGLTLDLKRAGSPLEVTSDRISAGLMEINRSIRSLAAGLVPSPIAEGGLRAGLQALAARMNEEYGFECDFLCSGPVTLQDSYMINQLYYIAQEAMLNAIRHSGGNRLVIELEQAEQHLTLRITDDGAEIATDKLSSGGGLGMYIMPYRAATIGGILTVSGTETGGTVVSCTLPLPGE